MDRTEGKKICDLEDRTIEITQSEQRRKIRPKEKKKKKKKKTEGKNKKQNQKNPEAQGSVRL